MLHIIILKFNWDIIPSWIQAITSLCAAIFLLITLRLQRKTFEGQEKINEVLLENYRQEYLPVFLNSAVGCADKMDGQCQCDLSLYNTGGTAYRVEIRLINKRFTITSEAPQSDRSISETQHIAFSFRHAIMLPEVENKIKIHLADILFQDAFGTKYKQVIFYQGRQNLSLTSPRKT